MFTVYFPAQIKLASTSVRAPVASWAHVVSHPSALHGMRLPLTTPILVLNVQEP